MLATFVRFLKEKLRLQMDLRQDLAHVQKGSTVLKQRSIQSVVLEELIRIISKTRNLWIALLVLQEKCALLITQQHQRHALKIIIALRALPTPK